MAFCRVGGKCFQVSAEQSYDRRERRQKSWMGYSRKFEEILIHVYAWFSRLIFIFPHASVLLLLDLALQRKNKHSTARHTNNGVAKPNNSSCNDGDDSTDTGDVQGDPPLVIEASSSISAIVEIVPVVQ